RSTPVERCTSMPISTRRATTFSICSSVARSCMTTTMTSTASAVCDTLPARLFPVHHAPLEPPRLIDDPLEQPRDRVGPERSLGGDAAHVRDHFFLAIRLIDVDAALLLDAADLARDARALVQQAHQHLVDAIDVSTQIVN